MCSEEQFHHFNRSVRNVAIIGSGPSGTPAARHLRDAGLNVRVFERQDKPGGIWNWRPSASSRFQSQPRLLQWEPSPQSSGGMVCMKIQEEWSVRDSAHLTLVTGA